MIKRRFSPASTHYTALIALFFPAALGLAGCTPERIGEKTGSEAGLNRELAALTTKVSTVSAGCSAEEIAAFEQIEGEPIDLDREVLPRGYFLATVSEVILDKKSDSGPIRLRVREIPGGKTNREIICSENTARLEPDFEMAITGVVKFDTSSVHGVNFTARQFHIFRDREKNDYGVVVSTPAVAASAQNLKQALSGSAIGQIFRQDDKNYVLKLMRERDGYRVLMVVRLEFVPQV